VITTTPNSQDDPSGEFAYQIRAGSLHFRLEFYDYGPTKVKRMMESQAIYNFIYAEYTYLELGRGEEWFKAQCRDMLNDMAEIKKELLLHWPLSTSGSVFTEEQLDTIKRYKKNIIGAIPIKPRLGIAPPDLEFTFLEVPDVEIPYILTFDPSSGVGVDYSSYILIHPDDMRPIGGVKTNSADNDAIECMTEYLMCELFPKSIIVIERNHYLGIVVINHLLKIEGMEARIYYEEKEKEAERTVGKMVVKSKKKVREYGVTTGKESREIMFRHLFQIVDEHPELLAYQPLQDEVRTLCRTKTGKIEARKGFHDDVLMSYLIGVYAFRHEKPVLRGMLSRMRTSKMQQSMNMVSVLNTSLISPASLVASVNPNREVITVDEYIKHSESNEQQVRQKRMSSLIANLNSGYGMDSLF
jgi:hypothetical protein